MCEGPGEGLEKAGVNEDVRLLVKIPRIAVLLGVCCVQLSVVMKDNIFL